MGEKHKSNKERLKEFHYKHVKRWYKFIPIIGIILLIALFSSQKNLNESGSSDTNLTFYEKVTNAWNDISNSFKFDSFIEVLITLVVLVTIWTGYKYWLVKLKYLRDNYLLLKNIVIVSMVYVFVDRHIKLNSFLGKYLDWMLFILFLYLVLAGAWYVAKTIDRIDLSSDLYCWGLRILGAMAIFFGLNLIMSSALVFALSNSKVVLNNIYWIAGLCITFLGAFMAFRSFRRYPMIKVW